MSQKAQQVNTSCSGGGVRAIGISLPTAKNPSLSQSIDSLKILIGSYFLSSNVTIISPDVLNIVVESPIASLYDLNGNLIGSIFDGNSFLIFCCNDDSDKTPTDQIYQIIQEQQRNFTNIANSIEKNEPVENIDFFIDMARHLNSLSFDAILFATLYAYFLHLPAATVATSSTVSSAWFEKKRVQFQNALKILPSNFFCDLKSLANVTKGIEVSIDLNQRKLPIEGKRNILITSALPYVNNVPHLGNIIGCVLSADVFARYCRLREYQTLYVCGTDEYGTATETKALEEGVSCQELCDKYYKLQSDVYKWFDISFDYFGRTTTQYQTTIAQDIFLKLLKNDLLLKEAVQQLLCEGCNRFLADRFVEGICPFCRFNDARGDQCDGCGKLINACELIEPRCKICRQKPVLRQSEHLFLDLTKLQEKCENFVSISSSEGKWSPNGISITNAWLQEGLKPRCITRDLKWGTPVPLNDMKEKVFYVWFDAPIGYISITANYCCSDGNEENNDWTKWWKNPKNVQLYQFMGKDNVPFHSVIFPCSLIGTGDDYTLVNHISTTEYLNYEGGKFSKSRNVGVFGHNVVASQIPSSVWRYYLLANRPESSDATFIWDDFGAKTNAELLANFGNFTNRTLKFLKSKYEGIVPFGPTNTENGNIVDEDEIFVDRINKEIQTYVEFMELVKLKGALKAAMTISSIGNEYLSNSKLDSNLFLEKKERCAQVINVAVNVVYLLATLLYPFIPTASEDLLRQLNAPLRSIPMLFHHNLLPGHSIGTPAHLFKRLEEDYIKELKSMYGGATKSN